MSAAAYPPPLIPPALVLPGIGEATDVAIDLDLLDRSSPRDPACFAVCIELYIASYKQRPTGSLPSERDALRELLLPASRDAEWGPVEDLILRRWTVCSDGRLYRRQLAVSVLTTWLELALMPLGLDAMVKSDLLPDAMLCLQRLKPRAEILGRVASATGAAPRTAAEEVPSDPYDCTAAITAGDLARIIRRTRR